MKNYDYSIENLTNVFEKHARQCDELNENAIKEYKEDFPNHPVPAWFTNGFNINDALKSMCTAIKDLQEKK